MNNLELAIWSGMLGGLLTLTAGAMVNALATRNTNSVRMLLFVAATGASSLVRTGLVETLMPEIPEGYVRMLKVCAGPLSAALVIRYMAIWLGGVEVDPTTYRVAAWGSRVMVLSALVLGVLVVDAPDARYRHLLQATAAITAMATLIGLLASIRATMMGDPLARWAVLAGSCLTVTVFGLYVRSLDIPGFGLLTWVLTAVCTVAYFLVGSVVVILRIRQTRRLERLARLQSGADPATGLPTGSVLLSEVEHAIWRTTRINGECTVVCLHLGNLYALGASAGPDAENQILTAMAARIRQAAGFRCVVGLYHPRCFVVVMSSDKRGQSMRKTVSRLRALAAQPLTVVGPDGMHHDFRPQLGVGVVPVSSADARPADVINEAERQALGAPEADDESENSIPTVPCDRLGDTGSAALQ